MRKKTHTGVNVFANRRNYANKNLFGMPPAHYVGLQKMLTGIESPGGALKKRVRVYFEGERMTLKWYLRTFFNGFFKRIDDDANRVVFICDSETKRDQLAAILNTIREDVDYEIPDVGTPDTPEPGDGGGGDYTPEPGDGGGGDYTPEPGDGGGGNNAPDKSKTNTMLMVVGVVAIVIVVIIKTMK